MMNTRTLLALMLMLSPLLCVITDAQKELGCDINAPHITRITTSPDPTSGTTLTGSVHGGSTFYIHGSNFDGHGFNNQVVIGSFGCEVIDYYTSYNMIACTLPVQFYDIHKNLPVVMRSCGKMASCNNGDCTVNLEIRYTPLLTTVLPQATFAGSDLTIRGIWRTYHYSDLKEVRISGFNCSLTDEQIEMQSTLHYWHTRNIDCTLADEMPIGEHMVSVTSQKGTGFNHPLRQSYGFQVGHETSQYNLRIHPKVESLNGEKGYLNGKQIVIKGQGFGLDKSKISVKLEDKVCRVTKVESVSTEIENEDGTLKEIVDEYIYCDLELANNPFGNKLFKGGVGFRRQMFNGTNRNFHLMLEENFQISGKDPTVIFDDLMLSLENDLSRDHYVQKIYGVFRTNEQGDYKFRIAGDDQSRLYISKDPIDYTKTFTEGVEMETVCNISGWTYFREWTREASQKGTKTMEPNSDYYMMVFQTEGGGLDSISVGMTVPNSTENQINRAPNVQKIQIESDPIREKLVVQLMHAMTGDFTLLYFIRNTETGKYSYFKETRKLSVNESEYNFARYIRYAIGITCKVTRENLDASGNVIADDSVVVKGYRWTIEYQSYYTRKLVPIIYQNTLKGDEKEGEPPVSVSVSQLQPQSAPVAGRFKLKYKDQTTSWIGYNYSWGSVVSRLQEIGELSGGLSGYHHGSSYDGKAWYIVFDSITGNAEPLTVVDMQLTGGNGKRVDPEDATKFLPDITIDALHEEATNDLVHLPIPSDFLRTVYSTPQMVVTVGEMMAGCAKELCNYEFYGADETPTVKEWKYDAAKASQVVFTLEEGYQLMKGGSLIGQEDQLRVRFGNTDCTMVDSTLPEIRCDLDLNTDGTNKLEVGTYKPLLHLKEYGYFKHGVGVTNQNVDLVYTSVFPARGSIGGGTMLTIKGTGFAIQSEYANTNTVTVNDLECKITEYSNIKIVCETPEVGSTPHKATIKITTNGETVETQDFEYDLTITPKISLLLPKDSSPVLKADLIIQGTKFSDQKDGLTVWLIPHKDQNGGDLVADADGKLPLDKYDCNVASSTETNVICRLSGGKSGQYLIKLHKKGVGFSIPVNENDNLFTYHLLVDGLSPNSGSKEGGTLLTITGDNFSPTLNENQVVIGESGHDYCIIQTASEKKLTCIVNKPAEVLVGEQKVYVIGRAQEEAVCPEEFCKFTFADDKTPTATKVEPIEAVKDSTISIEGTSFLTDITKISVMLGDTEAQVLTATETKITFQMPEMQSESNVPRIKMGNLGYVKWPEAIELFNKLLFTGVSPAQISLYGHDLVLNGNGFISGESLVVKVNGKYCKHKSVSPSQMTCELPQFGSNSKEYEVELYRAVNGLKERVPCETCKIKTFPQSPKIAIGTADGVVTPTPNTADLNSVKMALTGFGLLSDSFNDNAETIIYDATKTRATWSPLSEEYEYFEILGTSSFMLGQVNTEFTNMMAGSFKFKYFTAEGGYAGEAHKIKIENLKPVITTIPKIKSSFVGGSHLVIEGKGFPKESLKHLAKVQVCGLPCQVESTSYGKLVCLTPVLNTPAVQALYDLTPNSILRDALPINDKNYTHKNTFDGDIKTYYSGTGSSNCFTGMDYGDGNYVSVTKVRMFPRIKDNRTYLYGGDIECYTLEGEWKSLVNVGSDVVENWNEYRPKKDESWECQKVRFKGGQKYCRVAELEVSGRLYTNIENLDINSHKCNVKVSVMGVDSGVDLVEIVEYKQSLTPEVDLISPRMGTTGGGTEITVTGKNFQTDSVVTIDGIDCPINDDKSELPTKLVCTTGARPKFTPSTFVVSSAIIGNANTKEHVFLYIDRWSSEETWGGEAPPREGDSVYIPHGQVLLVDISPPKLYLILVEGTLIFKDMPELDLHAWFIMNREGRIEAGMPGKPYEGKLTITMYGDRYSKMLPGFGNKGIFTHNGTIDLHGVVRNHTWTFLKTTALKDSTTIEVLDPVDWKAGEEIVIAPTSRSKMESEMRTISSVANSPNGGKILTLTKALNFGHFAGTINPNDPDSVDKPIILAAEVGLLTRNIKVQGDLTTNITGHGAHILARGTEGLVKARYSYIEVFNAGQKFQLGRYPIHFHMIGHVHDMYVLGCAVHHTFNRGTTIHGVHYLTLRWNVYYHTMGHTIFFEDGIESNNLIEHNLVIHVRPAPSMLQSDKKPSGIWMARPSNFIRKNHLVGCDGNGVWFELVGSPTGPSSALGSGICSSKETLLMYEDNVHHSNSIGIRIYPFWVPLTNPCGGISNHKKWNPYEDNPGDPAKLMNNILYMNGLGNLNKVIGAIHHTNPIFISNGTGQTLNSAKSASDTNARDIGGYMIGNSAISDFHNVGSSKAFSFGKGGHFMIKETRFYDFPSGGLFSFCGPCGSELKRVPGGIRQSFRDIRIERVDAPLINFRNALYDKDIIRDFTGGLLMAMDLSDMDETEQNAFKVKFKDGGWVTPWFPHLNIPECVKNTNRKNCNEDCAICDNNTTLLRTLYQVLDNANMMYGQDLKIYNLDSPNIDPLAFSENWVFEDDKWKDTFSETKFRNCQLSMGWRGWASVLATGYSYNHHFGWGVEWIKVTGKNGYFWSLYETPEKRNDPIVIRWNHTEPRELFDGAFSGLYTRDDDSWVTKEMFALDKVQTDPPAKALTPLVTKFLPEHSVGDYYHDPEKKLLYWKLDSMRKGTITSRAIYCRDHCPQDEVNDVEVEVNKRRDWSKAEDWNIEAVGTKAAVVGKVPLDGEVVTIEMGWNMFLNVKTAKLKHLVVKGRLTFDPEVVDLELHTFILEIRDGGEVLIGSATAPHEHQATIFLYGDKNSEYLVLSPGIAPVNKTIVNKGKLHLFGKPPRVTWSRLKLKASKDVQHITLIDENSTTDWAIGDKLVIASSTTKADEFEYVQIEKLVTNSGQVNLTTQLKYMHYGSAFALDTAHGQIDMRAEVGNLTRNVKIVSVEGDYWGCTIVTPNILDEAGNSRNQLVQGNIKMDGVEIKDCGQRDTKKAAIDMNFVKDTEGSNFIKNSSFHSGQGWAVNLYATKGFDFINNVVYNPRKYAIFIQDSQEVKIDNNLLVGIKKRENYDNDEYWDLYIGIYYNDTTSMKDRKVYIRHNSVSSMHWFGYAVPGYACTEDDTNPAQMNFYNNTAHSNKAGWFPTKIDNQECNRFANFKGYKNSEQGFAQRVDIRRVEAKNMILADNRNAFAMNGSPGSGKALPFAKLTDSTIIGKALDDCNECYKGNSECETSGLYSALFNGSAYDFYFEKTRMPLHNSTSVHFKLGGKQELSDITIKNFVKDESCGKVSYAIRMNNFYQDNTSEIYINRVTLENVSDENKFYFANPKKHPNSSSYCGMNLCTGNNNTPFYDMDGSIFGEPNKEMHFFGNNRGAGQDGDCTYFAEWNGHACNPVYGQLIIKVPADERGLRFQPVTLTIDDYAQDVSDSLKFNHSTDSPSNIVNMVKMGKMTNITFSQSLPSGVRYELKGPHDTDYAMFKVYSENPATMSIYVNGSKRPKKPIVLKAGQELDLSKYKTKCGMNYYDAPNRIMYFLLITKGKCFVHVKLVNSLKLSTRLNIDPETFYETDGVTTFLDRMAALLEINVDRIRIVGIRKGSTIVDVEISQEEDVTTTRSNKEAAKEELLSFKDKFEQAVENGTVDLGADILDVTTDLAIDNVEYVPPVDDSTPDEVKPDEGTDTDTTPGIVDISPKKSKTTLYIILGIVIPFVLIAIGVVIYFVCKKKKNSRSTTVYNTQSMDVTRTNGSIRMNENQSPYKANNMGNLATHGNFARGKPIQLNPTGKLDSYIRRK